MKNHKGNGNWGKTVPIISIAVCATAFFLIGQPLSHQDLAEWLPQNRTLAVLATMLMYAVKSLTIFFPLVSLYLLCGILFPLPEAILLNLLGLAVSTTVPYWMGRLLGSRLLDQLRKKFSKLELLETLRRKSGFQFAVLTRSAGVLPGDVVSLYFAASDCITPSILREACWGSPQEWSPLQYWAIRSLILSPLAFGLRQAAPLPSHCAPSWPAEEP